MRRLRALHEACRIVVSSHPPSVRRTLHSAAEPQPKDEGLPTAETRWTQRGEAAAKSSSLSSSSNSAFDYEDEDDDEDEKFRRGLRTIWTIAVSIASLRLIWLSKKSSPGALLITFEQTNRLGAAPQPSSAARGRATIRRRHSQARRSETRLRYCPRPAERQPGR